MNIDKLLERQGKTRYWLAKQLGVAYPTIARIADGKAEKITVEYIYKFTKLLDCDFNTLFEKSSDIEELPINTVNNNENQVCDF